MAHDANSEASATAVRLIEAAVVASPPVPADAAGRGTWLGGVGELAASLYRQAQALDEHIGILSQCSPIPCEIVRVEESGGRGVITYKSPMGRPQYKAKDGTEVVRTPFLRERRGRDLLEAARRLVGQQCRIGKYVEEKADGTGSAAMAAWIDPVETPVAPPERVRDQEAEPNRTTPSASAAGTGLDLAALRNLKTGTWEQLVAAAKEHFDVPEEKVWETAMEQCGASGPSKPTHFLKVWNAVVSRYHQSAAA